MNNEKQKLLIEYLVSSPDLWARCSHIVKANYWDPEYRDTIDFLREYHKEYGKVPNPDKILAEAGLSISLKEVDAETMEYTADEIETFCRNKACEAAIIAGARFLEKKDYGSILNQMKEAITVSLNRHLGLDYFNEPDVRLAKLKERKHLVKTGWETLDYKLYGGLNRQELLVFAGESGVGKSMTLLNLARNLSKQGYNGIYYSLELSEEVIARRMDSMMSGYGQREIVDYIDQIATAIEMKRGTMGHFIIKQFPASTTTTNHLRAHLAEFQLVNDWMPDYVIIDYLDLMIPTVKISMDNLFVKDKFVSEEIRSLGVEFNCVMATASQLNRTAIDQDRHNQSMIAGGISKINTADNVISIRQTDKMRACGEIAFQFLKTRSSNAVGKTVYLSWDPTSLIIRDDQGGKSQSKEQKSEKTVTKGKSKVSELLGAFQDK